MSKNRESFYFRAIRRISILKAVRIYAMPQKSLKYIKQYITNMFYLDTFKDYLQ